MKCSYFLLVLRSDPRPQGLPPLTRASMNLQVLEPPHLLGTLSCPVPYHPIHCSVRPTFTCFHTAIPSPYMHISSLTSPSYAQHALEYKSSFSRRPQSLLTLSLSFSLLSIFLSHQYSLEQCTSFLFLFSPRSSVDQSQTGGLGTRFSFRINISLSCISYSPLHA